MWILMAQLGDQSGTCHIEVSSPSGIENMNILIDNQVGNNGNERLLVRHVIEIGMAEETAFHILQKKKADSWHRCASVGSFSCD